MSWSTPVDLYCERLDPGFWAEPVNALSNLAFPLAALLAWRLARQNGQDRPVIAVLCVLAALIGIGSFLFHSFANRWSEYADVIPIWSFVALYVLTAISLVGGVAPRRTIRIGVIAAAITTVIFLATTGEAEHTHGRSILNGSEQYAPALLALIVFSGVTVLRRHSIRSYALAATVTFTLSLMFRSVDLHMCDALPLGTHFMWHVLNAAMVGLLLTGLVRCARPA